MPTTARGIWTPSDTDAVDFTTHLATMAGTIDTALTNLQNAVGAGANAYRGTAAQRAAFLATAVVGQLWQDTDSITMLWKKVGAAWVPAVWSWQGTTAQMNAFTVAPNGFSWFNTTNDSEYVRLAGAWKAVTTPWVFPAALIGTNSAVNPIKYRRNSGRTELGGQLILGVSGTIFMLPTGFRIDGNVDNVFPVDQGGYARMNIRNTGEVLVSTLGSPGVNLWLSPVSFPAIY